jgi:hypothetical protein
MKARGLSIKPRRRFVRTSDSDHDYPVFPNRYRNVIPSRPDVVWVADITFSTPSQRGPPEWGPSCLSMSGMHGSTKLILQ